jgi:hypothetical protein
MLLVLIGMWVQFYVYSSHSGLYIYKAVRFVGEFLNFQVKFFLRNLLKQSIQVGCIDIFNCVYFLFR